MEKDYIGEKLGKYREKSGMTQKELAQKIGMSERNLANIEAGTVIPRLINLYVICQVLHIPMDCFQNDKQFVGNAVEDYLEILDDKRIVRIVEFLLTYLNRKRDTVEAEYKERNDNHL